MMSKILSRRVALRGTLGLVLLAFTAAGCRSAGGGGGGPTPDETTYFTKFGMRLERNVYRSTNYRSDRTSVLIPINTEVKLKSMRGRRITMQLVGGNQFTVEHIEKHSQDTRAEAFGKLFATEAVDLSGFSEEERKSIERGEAAVGMSREAVLAAIGPPPAVGTLSLDSQAWKYWNTRFTTFHVRFGDDGRVNEIGR